MNEGGNTVPRISKAEHIGPDDTGDNIEAKRVAPYRWTGEAWERSTGVPPGFITKPYDFVAATYPTASSEIYTFKTGGSGGTTTDIITVVYTDDTKESLNSAART